jgi:hypothetical protein
MRLHSFAISLLVLAISSCGADTNINQIFGGNDNAADTLYTTARAAYDQGNFEDAKALLEEALARNDQNERAAILLGYVHLSLGGIDPYRLARKLVDLESSNKTTGTSTKTLAIQDLERWMIRSPKAQAMQTDTASSSSSESTKTLDTLASLINLSEDDLKKLGEKQEAATFSSNPIILPNPVDDSLRNGISVLKNMNAAIRSVCRFVEDTVNTEDARHNDASCKQIDITRRNVPKAHFLWAFTHLTEVLVFQSVLLYSTGANSAASTSNFQSAISGIDENQAFSGFIDSVTSVQTAIDKVFDTDDPNSMITATLNDLQAVTKAFEAMPGMPDSIKKPLTKVTDTIASLAEKLGGAGTQVDALKGEFTKKFSASMQEKMDTAVASQLKDLGLPSTTKLEDVDGLSEISESEKTQLKDDLTKVCSSFDAVSKGQPDTQFTKPSTCQ